MTDLTTFSITHKWPARHPDQLQLYSAPMPNGVKVSIMLEETLTPYEPHLVSFETQDQMTPEFFSLSPNNKIPAETGELVGIQDFPDVTRGLAAFVARSAVVRGLGIPKRS